MKNSFKAVADIKALNDAALVSGILCFKTVPSLRTKGNQLIKNHARLEFDFENVTYSDSSGLVLLVAWLRFARKNHKNIVFKHLPTSLLAIAKVGGLDKILPLE